ncbi:MAG: TerD family protein [Muribaculaceae bacterium]|nr:TerD family protein [Muribaculaceae bacterium]
MAINLQKGQKINLEKNNGSKLTDFCVGCNWGAITKRGGFLGIGKQTIDVDLDLSCAMFDAQGKLVDFIYSPLYRPELLAQYGQKPGKLSSYDGALRHTGDDLKGDQNGNDGIDNEILTVDLKRVSPQIDQIIFFLNTCGQEDFSQIPYATIRMFEGTPTHVKEVFAQYDVAAEPQYAGMGALIMGKLYRRNGEWKFAAIGEAYADRFIGQTLERLQKQMA